MTSGLSVADGVLPVDDWQLGSLTKPIQKPSFMPVMRHSTHSRVGCDCNVGSHASATKGVEIGAASTMGGTVGGALWYSPPSRWIWQSCRTRRGATVVYANIGGAGPEPEWVQVHAGSGTMHQFSQHHHNCQLNQTKGGKIRNEKPKKTKHV